MLVSQGHVSQTQYDTDVIVLDNESIIIIWKLHCYWLNRFLWHITLVKHGPNFMFRNVIRYVSCAAEILSNSITPASCKHKQNFLMSLCIHNRQKARSWIVFCKPFKCWCLNFISTVPADGLAPNGARPSAGMVLTTNIECLFQSLAGYDVWLPFSTKQ